MFTSTFTSAHLHLCSSSHPHIYMSAHLHILTSTHLHPTSLPLIYVSHLHLSLFLTSSLKTGGSAAGPPRNATLCGDRACRAHKMQTRVRFVFVRRNPLRRSFASRARNAGESAFLSGPTQPSAEIVRVEGAKCRRECVLTRSGATLCGDRACRRFSTILVRGVSGELEDENWRLCSTTLVRGVSGELEDENWRLCSTT